MKTQISSTENEQIPVPILPLQDPYYTSIVGNKLLHCKETDPNPKPK